MISPFREDFIFTKLGPFVKFREKKIVKISEFTVEMKTRLGSAGLTIRTGGQIMCITLHILHYIPVLG